MVKITFQTHAIMRYIARKHDLCGKVLDMLGREGQYVNIWEFYSDRGGAGEGGYARRTEYGLQVL